MKPETQGILLLCGVCCIYPAIVATLAIIAYRRYQSGGWKAVIFGDRIHDKTL